MRTDHVGWYITQELRSRDDSMITCCGDYYDRKDPLDIFINYWAKSTNTATVKYGAEVAALWLVKSKSWELGWVAIEKVEAFLKNPKWQSSWKSKMAVKIFSLVTNITHNAFWLLVRGMYFSWFCLLNFHYPLHWLYWLYSSKFIKWKIQDKTCNRTWGVSIPEALLPLTPLLRVINCQLKYYYFKLLLYYLLLY